MARLSVPERYQSGIAAIGNLPEKSFSDLFAALQKSPELSDTRELLAWIGKEVPGMPSDLGEQILNSLASMTRARESGNSTPAQFACDVWEAIHSSSPQLVKGVDQKTFELRVTKLLQKTPIDLPRAKIEDLKSEVERNYCDARILTDLRAGFRKTVDDSVSLMVLLHTLRIGYHDDQGEHREFYVSMDAIDLRNMKDAVERAQRKAAALKKAMKAANIEVVE